MGSGSLCDLIHFVGIFSAVLFLVFLLFFWAFADLIIADNRAAFSCCLIFCILLVLMGIGFGFPVGCY